MAEARPLDLDLSGPEIHALPLYRRLGLINGLLIGLALGLGAWGMEAWRIAQLPIPLYLPSLLLGLAAMAALGGAVGWLSSRIARTPVTVLLWGVTAILAMLLMGYLPYYGRTLVAWLADTRFWGKPIYPYTLGGTVTGLVFGSLLILLALGLLALLQGHRLESLMAEAGHRGRLNGRVWVSLLLPLPLVFLAALVTQSMMSNPAAAAANVVHEAIELARVYEGDLIDLEQETGVEVTALRGVHDRLGETYSLAIVDVNPLNSTVIIRADFDNGAWLYCRVINDQLSFCYDAAPAYTIGLRSLITGEPPPEDCRGCILQAEEDAAAWLAERRDAFGPDPAIERVAQSGSHVLMRVTGEAGVAAECWIAGVTPARLLECTESVNQ